MHVVVIGAGIAGLSAAVGLARHGIEVDVIEADSPQEQTGAGISLLGNALRALGELDLADPCLDAGYGFDTIDIVDGDGNVMMSDRAPRTFRPDRPASFGILRSTLHSVLADGAAHAGARLRYECTVTSIQQDDAGADLTLSTGEQLRADLVVAADGTYSSTRTAVFGAESRARVRGPRRLADHLPAARTPARPRADAQPGRPGRRGDPALGRMVLRLHSREHRRTDPDRRRPAPRVDGRTARRVQRTADPRRRRIDQPMAT